MPYCVLLMLLFWNVLLLFPVPRLVTLIVLLPDPTPNVVAVLLKPTRLTFLIVLWVAPSGPAAVWSQMTAPPGLLVFVMVRSRDEVPLLEPSKMIQSAPFKMKRAVVAAPVME